MKSINYFKNGFELIYNTKKEFITWQSIVKISDVKITVDYSDIENLVKYSYFTIDLCNEKDVIISLDSGDRKFRRIDLELTGFKFIWYLISGKLKNYMDKEARNWSNNKELDMYESVCELKEFREEFIGRFNGYREC